MILFLEKQTVNFKLLSSEVDFFFNQVRVDPKTDILTWGDEIDLDPYEFREKILKQKS